MTCLTFGSKTFASVPKDVLHRDIARRYRAHGRAARAAARIKSPVANLRLVELERIFSDRFGKFIPDNSAGRAALQVLAEGFLLASGNGAHRCIGLVKARAPWALAEIGNILDTAASCGAWQSADKMAWRIQLTSADRSRLKIYTIGALDVTVGQREAAVRLKKIKRQAAKRSGAGATSRNKSLAQTKPWAAAGISRATWYRQRANDRETISVRLSILKISKTEIVSRGTLQRAREHHAGARALQVCNGWGGVQFAPAELKHSAASRRPSPSASALVCLVPGPRSVASIVSEPSVDGGVQ